MHNCPFLAPKQTSARIDFLRQGERLVDKNGTHNVKILTESWTKRLCCMHARVGNGTIAEHHKVACCLSLKAHITGLGNFGITKQLS